MYSDAIRYIGVDDVDIDLFEGQYEVPSGMSYNSYVILDDKIAVMDTVDLRKVNDYLANLKAALEDRKPDYLIVHHVEPDHASSLQRFLDVYPDVTLVGNAKTFQMLENYFHLGSTARLVVKEGERLELGLMLLEHLELLTPEYLLTSMILKKDSLMKPADII